MKIIKIATLFCATLLFAIGMYISNKANASQYDKKVTLIYCYNPNDIFSGWGSGCLKGDKPCVPNPCAVNTIIM